MLSAAVSLASPQFEAFRAGLRELGYVEGQTIELEFRSAERRFERAPALAAELVNLKENRIFAGGHHAPAAVRDATSTIPIVFGVSGDPVAEGLVASLARPGGDITGPARMSPELVAEHLELL
jgi:putative tryptophan/tyrosine transport system substrate-binding protein